MRFHLDEHVAPAVAHGLRRRGINVTTTSDAGLQAATDEQHVEYGTAAKFRWISVNSISGVA